MELSKKAQKQKKRKNDCYNAVVRLNNALKKGEITQAKAKAVYASLEKRYPEFIK